MSLRVIDGGLDDCMDCGVFLLKDEWHRCDECYAKWVVRVAERERAAGATVIPGISPELERACRWWIGIRERARREAV